MHGGGMNHPRRSSSMQLEQRIAPIQLILCDVDGVLTDGGITYDNNGIEIKTFHVRDGLGIKLWQNSGGKFGLITARNSHIVRTRAAELGIELIRQGFSEKLPIARQIMEELDIEPSSVCFIGDDLADLPLVSHVGLGVAVADAVAEVRNAAHYVTSAPGGKGAVRELMEFVLKAQGRWDEVTRKYHSP
jgi:YrbI family 3-deoxy-D-manno-octulosonate 8-phosphate phosphatase